MKKLFVLSIAMPLFAMVASVTTARAGNPHSVLTLGEAGPSFGAHALTGQSGSVDIKIKNGATRLKFSVSGLTPNAVHSAWLIFDTTQAPFSGMGATLAATDPITGTTAPVFPSTPATAETSGFTGGVGIDPNGFITDSNGNATFTKQIDYDITQLGAAPIVLRPGTTQAVAETPTMAGCVAGGSLALIEDSTYMRTYDTTGLPPLFQQNSGQLAPTLVRGNVMMIMLIEHFDGLTHGHTAGVPFGSATTSPPGNTCGDWAPRFAAILSDAVPK